jgi:tRNA modification GTPase
VRSERGIIMSDTICAISTALGVGAVSMIRVSGKEAIPIVSRLFNGDNLNNVNTHTIHYGFIVDNEEKIDEVLVTVMKSPKTFTREDVVEINCHGGIATNNKVLELLLLNGCRLAEPGEFTKRAFLNGRINLMEAEAVADLINGKTEEARRVAISQMQGSGSKLISKLREDLVGLISNIEVNIDYPEYQDIYEVTVRDIKEKISYFHDSLTNIINNYENGRILTDGIKTVIVGRPNVGKSSILNKLLDYNKAIVTDIPGTTRDIVEGNISFNGILLNIIDTAGIRDTDDVVEKIGVEISLSKIEEADLVLVILNNNEELSDVDLDILNKTKDKTSIIVINKNDLDSKIDLSRLEGRKIVYTNTVTLEGIDTLKDKITELFKLEEIKKNDYNYITNVRQISKIKECLKRIDDIKESLDNEVPLDMIEIDLRDIWDILGEIIGESYTEELLDELFSKFCVGK